jgi:CheY-like chemotaxis protein
MALVRHPASPKEAIMASDIGDLFIIDDDAKMRDALSVVFTLAGYRVTGFVDGETFHAVASARTAAAVLLDLHLPAKSGSNGAEGTGCTQLSRDDPYSDG